MSVRDRLRDVAERLDVLAVRRDEQAVDSLEEAVAENARLAEGLTAQVREIERSLLSLLEPSGDDEQQGPA
ncbi:hypothetical protein [Nocardioides sp. SYSU D00038]|uniref:hypothetical protein n=1 Tax=Nocardioides sp. SYSU D00038 TaxID=2812554 RepID=UPI00196800E4|nr:hypothetical protein [Nocardioides sp. SYSU D00038]